MLKKEGVRTIFKLLQNKIVEFAEKRFKKDERSSSQYKELCAGIGIGKLSDEIKCAVDELDKNSINMVAHVIADFHIIGNIRIYGQDGDPTGSCLIVTIRNAGIR